MERNPSPPGVEARHAKTPFQVSQGVATAGASAQTPDRPETRRHPIVPFGQRAFVVGKIERMQTDALRLAVAEDQTGVF